MRHYPSPFKELDPNHWQSCETLVPLAPDLSDPITTLFSGLWDQPPNKVRLGAVMANAVSFYANSCTIVGFISTRDVLALSFQSLQSPSFWLLKCCLLG
jgi:hypothetical protein